MTLLQKTIKLCLLSVFILFLSASGAFIYAGGYTLYSLGTIKHIANDVLLAWPAGVSIVVGVIFFLIATIGCVSCLFENRILLITFFVLLFLVLVGQIVTVSVSASYKMKLQGNIEHSLWNEIYNYGANSYYRNELDFIQSVYHCCGVWNLSDWFNSTYYLRTNYSLPYSCSPPVEVSLSVNRSYANGNITCLSSGSPLIVDQCNTTTMSPASKLYYGQGCLKKLNNQLKNNLVLIVIVGSCFLIIQIFGLLSSAIIIYHQKKIHRYETFTNEYGEQI